MHEELVEVGKAPDPTDAEEAMDSAMRDAIPSEIDALRDLYRRS
jgi:hypothetical protein